jgi:crotonobetainyl-CoA:carnitine CoA-transferase CaiB-like acyl-CoA transferase
VNVAIGLKAHSGWAALVSVGRQDGSLVVSTRQRIDLVEDAWAKQPYHAAEHLEPARARDRVAQGTAMARRMAVAELRAVIEREHARHHTVDAVAVLTGAPMPAWTVDEILSVHFRMHKAEGALFRDVLAQAATECAVKLVAIPEKQLSAHAHLSKQVAALGATVGPPWGKDQKDAALAALIALEHD